MRRYIIFICFVCLSIISSFSTINLVFADDDIANNDELTVRVGIYENQPKIFTDENGKASGFWPDIIAYIASKEGWNIEYIPGTWSECMERLETGEIDMMPDVAYTDERKELYDFSNQTVYVSWSRIYTREGMNIESIIDLEGKTVAVLKGSINYEGWEGIKELVSKFDIDCTFIEVDSYKKVFELVESGQADAGVTSKDFGNQHEADYNIIKTAIVFQPSPLYFAFPQKANLSPYLIERIDFNVAALKQDQNSIYYKSLEKWLGAKPMEKQVMPLWSMWTLIGIAIVVLVLAGGSWILRQQVKARTKELTAEINERKKAEQLLRHSEEKLRTTFESMSEGLTITDLDGRITDINNATLRLHRYTTKEELIGVSTYTLIEHKDHPKARKNLRKILEEGYSGAVECTLLTREGDKFPAELRAAPLRNESGSPVAFVAITTDITERKKAEEEHKKNTQKLIKAMGSTIEAIALTVEMRDMYTAGHQRRVTKLAIAIAEEIKLPESRIDGLRMAGIVHDIGKIQIPAEILNKPGHLTEVEFSMIRNHPRVAYDILKTIEFAWPVAEIVLQHHERLNGSGYPSGLSGDQILMETKILSVADVVEAMASHRPYRPALGIDKALEEITINRGILYEAVVVDACCLLFQEKKYEL
jgi:PAS domain S-box-containing protein